MGAFYTYLHAEFCTCLPASGGWVGLPGYTVDFWREPAHTHASGFTAVSGFYLRLLSISHCLYLGWNCHCCSLLLPDSLTTTFCLPADATWMHLGTVSLPFWVLFGGFISHSILLPIRFATCMEILMGGGHSPALPAISLGAYYCMPGTATSTTTWVWAWVPGCLHCTVPLLY